METTTEHTPTIYDVAQRANVSISSVSRVMNDSTAVSEDIRRRVLQSMKELDYQPNRAAQALGQRR